MVTAAFSLVFDQWLAIGIIIVFFGTMVFFATESSFGILFGIIGFVYLIVNYIFIFSCKWLLPEYQDFSGEFPDISLFAIINQSQYILPLIGRIFVSLIIGLIFGVACGLITLAFRGQAMLRHLVTEEVEKKSKLLIDENDLLKNSNEELQKENNELKSQNDEYLIKANEQHNSAVVNGEQCKEYSNTNESLKAQINRLRITVKLYEIIKADIIKNGFYDAQRIQSWEKRARPVIRDRMKEASHRHGKKRRTSFDVPSL